MGGIGCGRRWQFDADTTDDYRALDVRRLARKDLIEPDRSRSWQWKHQDELLSSIQMRAEWDRLFLSYRHRSRGDDWKDESYPVGLDTTP